MAAIWKSLLSKSPSESAFQPNSGKIEVFVRHCPLSSASRHKKRFAEFSPKACFHNLLETMDPAKANLTFFLDAPQSSSGSHHHFVKEQTRYPVVEIEAGSEASSFLKLLDMTEKLNLHPDTIVYFLEDDYLHRPGWTDILLEGFSIPKIDYVTLYDHRDKYVFPEYKKLASRIFATSSCHWRTTPSTTNTFAMRYKALLKHLPIHRRFSENRQISADHEKFCLLGKLGAVLISSIPGYSTHCEPEFASPCHNWQQMLRTHVLDKEG
jgi:hypothetical protein